MKYSVALAVLVTLGGCAAGVKPDSPYAIKVDKLSQQVNRLSRIVNSQQQVSLGTQVNQLSAQVRKLRGRVQVLSHAVDQANQRQRDLYQDLDRRLRALETGTSSGAAASSSATSSTQGDRAAYDHAFSLLQQGHYTQAGAAFSAFLGQYPKSDLADNAQYWLGESRYVTQDFKGAIKAFEQVVSQYPDSPKVSGALLKTGYSYAGLSKWDDARKALQAVVQKYPDSTEARLARKRLKTLKSQGH